MATAVRQARAECELGNTLVVEEVAKILDVSPSTVYVLAKAGTIRILRREWPRVGCPRGRLLFDAREIEWFRHERERDRNRWRLDVPRDTFPREVPRPPPPAWPVPATLAPTRLDLDDMARFAASRPRLRGERKMLALIAEARRLQRLVEIASGNPVKTEKAPSPRPRGARRWNRGAAQCLGTQRESGARMARSYRLRVELAR